MNAVFIDTFYDPEDSLEEQKFRQYTTDLMNFSQKVYPFECKDIKIALNELMEAQKHINDLMGELNEANEKLESEVD